MVADLRSQVWDVLDVQSSIAGEVVLALAPMVQTGEPREPVTTETILTRNPDAYTAYLRGLHFLRVWVNLEDFRNARDEFLSAVKLDPEFAKAHAYLAHSYLQMARYGVGDGPRMAALANASIDRALQLDPQLSDVWWVKLTISNRAAFRSPIASIGSRTRWYPIPTMRS